MRRLGFGFSFALVGLAAAVGASPSGPGLTVHEWGTFLVMQGSDGATLDGMYHEEHALPSWVHSRSKDQLRIPSVLTKGETPVIYFYTDRAQRVSVKVDFPQGVWTQWYPQASLVGPQVTASASELDPSNGHIEWHADIVPVGTGPAPNLPEAPKDALWHHSREVDAAYVRTQDQSRPQFERFLFYRGLGRTGLPVTLTTDAGGTIQSPAAAPELRHLFILRVENGKGSYRYLPSLAPGQSLKGVIPAAKDGLPMAQFTQKIADDLAARLAETGLFDKEARAMVNTWKSSYFGSDGIRALFVLPQAWTDRFIPMTIRPQPASLVRTMVGRLEVLSPERERKAEAAVRDLASADTKTRGQAFAFLREQGRYVEPIVRRVMRTSADPDVKALCKRLLLTDFVTGLRATVNSASTGTRLRDDQAHVRAQLASLLSEIGLRDEAKAEGERALAVLKTRPAPKMQDHISRHPLRATARALEAVGDDRAAAEAYAQFIRFGAGVKKCGGCHELEGPRNMAWYRDWWAGRKLAEYARRSGITARTISENEQALARNPGDTAAQMLLAYLYEGEGRKDRAEQMWVKVDPAAGPRRAGK
jgi:hypothetical protein